MEEEEEEEEEKEKETIVQITRRDELIALVTNLSFRTNTLMALR